MIMAKNIKSVAPDPLGSSIELSKFSGPVISLAKPAQRSLRRSFTPPGRRRMSRIDRTAQRHLISIHEFARSGDARQADFRLPLAAEIEAYVTVTVDIFDQVAKANIDHLSPGAHVSVPGIRIVILRKTLECNVQLTAIPDVSAVDSLWMRHPAVLDHFVE
jgi:hypothetical protein